MYSSVGLVAFLPTLFDDQETQERTNNPMVYAIVDQDRRIIVCTTNIREVDTLDSIPQDSWTRIVELKATRLFEAVSEAAAYGLKNLERLEQAFPIFRRR
jgi:hypothetical protein